MQFPELAESLLDFANLLVLVSILPFDEEGVLHKGFGSFEHHVMTSTEHPHILESLVIMPQHCLVLLDLLLEVGFELDELEEGIVMVEFVVE